MVYEDNRTFAELTHAEKMQIIGQMQKHPERFTGQKVHEPKPSMIRKIIRGIIFAFKFVYNLIKLVISLILMVIGARLIISFFGVIIKIIVLLVSDGKIML
ncbi:hypothetical protein M2145_002559 [Lachnospiraceae bacterium PF1-21]